MANFSEMLGKRWKSGARVCIGLDLDQHRIPGRLFDYNVYDAIFQYGSRIVQKTHDVALAYKLNLGFFVGKDQHYLQKALLRLIEYIREFAPGVPIILDAKWGDTARTNRGYVESAFVYYNVDAITLHFYPGKAAAQPFLDHEGKGIIVVCRMSTEDTQQQDRLVLPTPEEASLWGLKQEALIPYYQTIAYEVSRSWNANRNCSLVVGATQPRALHAVRKIVGDDMWLLSPGIGAQGGSIRDALRAGLNSKNQGLILSSSSDIVFASSGDDFAREARQTVEKVTTRVNQVLLKSRQHAPVS